MSFERMLTPKLLLDKLVHLDYDGDFDGFGGYGVARININGEVLEVHADCRLQQFDFGADTCTWFSVFHKGEMIAFIGEDYCRMSDVALNEFQEFFNIK